MKRSLGNRLRLAYVLLLAACTARDASYYPLAQGHWWYYTTRTSVLGETHAERLFVANETASDQGLFQRLQARHFRELRETNEGIAQVVATRDSAPHLMTLLPKKRDREFRWQSPSLLRLIESRTFAPEDRLRGRRLPFELTGQVIATDATVIVPAGKFTDCLHLAFHGTRNVRTDRGTHLVEVRVTHQEWYAPGIGLVKVERAERSESSFLQDGKFVQELAAYGR